MAPRKHYSNSKAKRLQASASTRGTDTTRDAQTNARLDDIQPGSITRSNGPITRSRVACSRLDSHATILDKTSIHRLPPEILTEMFTFVMDINSDELCFKKSSGGSKTQRRMLNPLTLCAVCSSRRLLAVSIPELWKKVSVHLPSDIKEAKQAEKKAASLVQWIKRARSLPLTLYLFYGINQNPRAPDIWHTPLIVSVLNKYSTRWEAMYLHQSTEGHLVRRRYSLSFPKFDEKSLERLCSKLCGASSVLQLNNTPQWVHLMHLQMRELLTAAEVITIIKQSPRLVKLSVVIRDGSFAPVPVIMYNLVSLSLNSEWLPPIANALSCPSLRDLYIGQLSSLGLEPFLSFLTRSSCILDKLEICASYLHSKDHLHILTHRARNSLTSLKILEFHHPSDMRIDDEVLRRLTFNQDVSLCPRLKLLTIDCSINCSTLTLFKMVESRIGSPEGQQPDEPLQYLHLRLRSRSNKLDKLGKEYGMEYSRRKHDLDMGHGIYEEFYSVMFRRRDLSRTELRAHNCGFSFED